MMNVDQDIVFRQYLSLLSRSVFDKLSEYALVKSMILKFWYAEHSTIQ